MVACVCVCEGRDRTDRRCVRFRRHTKVFMSCYVCVVKSWVCN